MIRRFSFFVFALALVAHPSRTLAQAPTGDVPADKQAPAIERLDETAGKTVDSPSAKSKEEAKTLDQQIDQWFEKPTEVASGIMFYNIELAGVKIPWVVLWLAIAAIVITLFFGFINLRGIPLALKTVRGKYSSDKDPGQITHFQALSSALSGTVGLGNIGGVAVAISAGGPGAAFWMILIGFFSMSTKFAECTLGVKYRQFDKDGNVRGGPMFYLKEGLREKGLLPLGMALAIISAIAFLFGSLGAGNMYQVNQACDITFKVLEIDEAGGVGYRWIFGAIMAVLVGIVIIGGIKSIGRVTSKLVPGMCILYLLGCLTILVLNFQGIPAAIGVILTEAFSPNAAVTGGIVGVFVQGMRRATFSNEAGLGSAPVAHSAVKTSKPASEGTVALLEPFLDTIVVCSTTAIVLVVTGVYEIGSDINTNQGVLLTAQAFETVVPWFDDVLAVAVILFAFSTMITWAYYGTQAISFLTGDNRIAEALFKIFFCGCAVVGAAASLGNVLDFSDATLFLMSVPNLIGVYLLLPVVRKEFAAFRQHAKEIDAGKNP